MTDRPETSAGIDVGTECIKVAVIDRAGTMLGSAVTDRRGYFQDRVQECFQAALDDARLTAADLVGVCATGFGASCAPMATTRLGATACHALGAFQAFGRPMSLVDLGARDPRVIHVNGQGHPVAIFTLRRCAAGTGVFLDQAAKHLDVHPTRLQELAAVAESSAHVGSYCSIFSYTDVLTRLREGRTREEVARGCIESIAERILEIGGFEDPVRVSGGVPEYYPGVLQSLAAKIGLKVEAISQPIMVGAVGAASWVFRRNES